MTRMTGPDCAVMRNLINTPTHTRTHTYTHIYTHTHNLAQRRDGALEVFNDWGGRGYDDSVPVEVTITAPSGDRTT